MPVPSKADQLYEQGRALLKERKIDAAAELFQQAIQDNSRHVGAHESLAAIYYARKDFVQAAAFFQKVTQYDPRKIDAIINLGAIQNRMKEFQSAAKTLRNAVSRDRKNAIAYYNLAIAQKGLNQPHLAVSAYKEALKIDPKMIDAIQNLANLYLEMGNLQQAQLQFHKALEVDPHFEKAKRGLERSYEMADEKKKAVNPFGRLVNMEELGKRSDQRYRKLSPREQYEDRTVIHQIAKEGEQAASVLLAALKERIGPLITRINQSLSQSVDPRLLMKEYAAFSTELKIFEQTTTTLRERLDDLRQHEVEIR